METKKKHKSDKIQNFSLKNYKIEGDYENNYYLCIKL